MIEGKPAIQSAEISNEVAIRKPPKKDQLRGRRSVSLFFGDRLCSRRLVLGSDACDAHVDDCCIGAVTDPMAMEDGIHKYGEHQPTTGEVCPSANSPQALCQRASTLCRCNTPRSSCHPSCESARPYLTAARFVGECLSDTNSFDSVDTCMGMYEHSGHEHMRAGMFVRACFSLVAICGSRFSSAPLGCRQQ